MDESAGEHVRGTQQVKECGLLGRTFAQPGFGVVRWFHLRNNTRYNDYCQDGLNGADMRPDGHGPRGAVEARLPNVLLVSGFATSLRLDSRTVTFGEHCV